MATQYKICLEQNKNREREVPENVIKRMRESFTCPQFNEGWDKIEIIYNYDIDDYRMSDYFEKVNAFDQENPHHTKTLGEHASTVGNALANKGDELCIAGFLHDNGKMYTKVFYNMKGDVSEIAHYYGHPNVGAYEALFYLNNIGTPEDKIIYVCGLIQFHMRPYDLDTEKSKDKLKRLVGEQMYNDLIVLNNADATMH
jgi:hypothetical protein